MIVTVHTLSGPGLVREAESAYDGVIRDPPRYAARAQEVLARARRAGDPEALVVALRAHAWARHAALDNAGAVALLGEAVRLAAAHGLDGRLGEVLTTRAVALLELGRHPAAARDLARAADLAQGSRRPEVVFQQAVLEHNAGQVRAAAELYRSVLADRDCPPETWVKAANNAAVAANSLGRPRTALPWLARAAELAAPMSPLLVAVTRNNLAGTTFAAGDVVTGLRLFEEAGALYGPAGLPLGEHYLDYADALVDLRLLDEALRITRAATNEFERQGASLMAAEARLRSGRLALEAGRPAQARDDVRQAREQLRRQRRTAWVARATLAEAQIALADGTAPERLLAPLRRAARTLEQAGMPAVAVEAHLTAGRIALGAGRIPPARVHLAAASRLARGQGLLVRLRGRLARALAADADQATALLLRECRRGLADLSRHRAVLPSVELRARAAGHGVELGVLGLRAVLRSGSPLRALDWMERTRTASWLAVEPPVRAVDEDVVELRAVEGELRTARRERGREPADLLARRAALESRIRRNAGAGDGSPVPGPLHPRRPDPGRLRDLLARSGPDVRLAELGVVDDVVHAVVLGSAGRPRLIRLGPLQPIATAAENAAFALRRVIRGGRFAAAAQADALSCLAELRQAVIEPLEVPDGAPLVVVPAAGLHRVPWAPLHPGPLTLAPSAEFWAGSVPVEDTTGTRAAERTVLIAGPGLPGAVDEVTGLGRVHPEAARLLPPGSTVEATVELVTGAGLAHLACHGRLRTDNPLFSSLELADGTLTVHELLARGVAPRRMVLAACDAGADGSYHGNEVLGFVSALMARGTTAVLASVLPLPDGASVSLMHRVHAHLRSGDSMAVALYRARTTGPGDPQPLDPQPLDIEALDPGTFTAWCGLAAYGAG